MTDERQTQPLVRQGAPRLTQP